jgi:hypothetical protein
MIKHMFHRICPNCGGSDFLTEPAVDEDGMPTGMILVTCASCGSELAELPPLEPGHEAEPEESVPVAIPEEKEF